VDPAISSLSSLIHDERINAGVAWVLVLFLLVAVGESAADGKLLWAGLAATIAVVAAVPAVAAGDPEVMVPWELLVLAALPVVGRSFGVLTQIATYLAVAALALLVAVEIDTFSGAEMTPSFALLFVVIASMAVAGVWAVAQWLLDAYLATSFLSDKVELMWDLVLATVVGMGAGLLFELYFRRDGARDRDGSVREREGEA